MQIVACVSVFGVMCFSFSFEWSPCSTPVSINYLQNYQTISCIVGLKKELRDSFCDINDLCQTHSVSRILGGNVLHQLAASVSLPHSGVQRLQTLRILQAIEQWTVFACLPYFGSNCTRVIAIITQPYCNLFVFMSRAGNQFRTAERGQLGGGNSVWARR